MTTWAEHVAAWSNPPVDDVGYMPASELFVMPDEELRGLVDRMRFTRYNGYRNYENRWRDVMGLDSLRGKEILDFGCGVGVEALELALAGNRVSLADIVPANLQLAGRVLTLFGQLPERSYLVTSRRPLLSQMQPAQLDVFYCNGVLHHSRDPRVIMERAHELLRPGGEVRLMVYSDVGWTVATGEAAPADVEADPNFNQFVRYFDSVGEYATWYNYDKLSTMFGDLFKIERCEYLTEDQRYLGVVLRKENP